MQCVHREDAKLRLSDNTETYICVICLVEYLTDSQNSFSARVDYAHSQLALCSLSFSRHSLLNKNPAIFVTAFRTLWYEYLLSKGPFAKALVKTLSFLLSHIPLDDNILQLLLSPLIDTENGQDAALEKCNEMMFISHVIEQHDISVQHAPIIILQRLINTFRIGNSVMQGNAAYCIGVLLRHTDILTTDSVAECCSALIDRLCQPSDESALPENVFECLRLLMKYPESFNLIITHKKLSFVLKMHLTSPKSELKIIALKFLSALLACSQPNRLVEFLLQMELLDFVYDCLSEEVTVATPAISLLITLTNSEYFMASNSAAYALAKVLAVKHDNRYGRDFRRLLNILLEKIFQNYSGSVELFINLSAIENFFANLRCEFADNEVSFMESTKCLLTYLRSEQVYRPFPLQLFMSCLGAYKQRLQNLVKPNNANVVLDKGLSYTSTEYTMLNETEGDTNCFLNDSLEIQLHLNNLLFLFNNELIQGKLELEQLLYFNKLLNELYFSLPLDTIWRLFSQKHIPSVLLYNLLTLSRKILKKGFRENALRVLNRETTSLPDCFFDGRIRRSFVYLLPEVIDVTLKSWTVYQADTHTTLGLPNEHFSEALPHGRVETHSPTGPTEIMNSVSQLMVYLIASGLVSFWTTFQPDTCSEGVNSATENHLVKEFAQFWEMIFNGIAFIPGTSVDTLCALLGEMQHLPADTFSSNAGRMCPALLAVTACLINRHQQLSNEDFVAENTGAALDSEDQAIPQLLSCLCAQITCVGVEYFRQLPPVFSVELLASLSIAYSCGVVLSPKAYQASTILAKALLDRLRSDHIHVLLSLGGFSIFLRQADPVWITLAQKMIYHVHANTELVLSGVVKNLPTTYEFLSLVWTVWFTALGTLDEPYVVDRLSETFTTGFETLKQSASEDSAGEAKLADFIAEELSSLSTKWGFPISSVFYKHDNFRRQFLSMLATVTNLSALFQNRLCLHRTVETLLDLIVDEECDVERDAVPLLSLLSTCLLLSEDPVFPQVSSMVGTRLKAAIRPWMIVAADACKEAAWSAYAESQKISKPLVEELLCLGAVLILGRSQSDQHAEAVEDSDAAAVFELSHVLLKAIWGNLCAAPSRRSFCSAALLLLNSAPPSSETTVRTPWPEGTSEVGRGFYTRLISALYSNLTDIRLRDLRLLTMALLGKALRIVRHQLPLKEVARLESTVWISVVTESLQLEDYDEDQLPCPPALIVFLAEVLTNSSDRALMCVDESLLQDIVIFYAQLPAPVARQCPFHLHKLMLTLSTGPCTFLRDQEKRGLLQKVSVSGFNPKNETALFSRSRYKFFLLPLLDVASLRGTVSS